MEVSGDLNCTEREPKAFIILEVELLDLLLFKTVDEHPEVRSDAILSVVKVGDRSFGVHVLTGVHFPVLEGAEDLLDGALGFFLKVSTLAWSPFSSSFLRVRFM